MLINKHEIHVFICSKLRCSFFIYPRNIIEILPAPGLQHDWKTSFITDFLLPLKNIYSQMLKQTNYMNCNGVSSQGSWKSVLVEVISCICCMIMCILLSIVLVTILV